MKKIFLLIIITFSISISSQKIGLVESYNPIFKHAHLKGIPNAKLQKVEDLEYNIKPYMDSIFSKSNLSITRINDFELSVFDKFDPIYENKKIEKQLYEYCKSNNLDGLIILKPYGNDKGKNILTETLKGNLDYGLISYESAKKSMMYYNNIIILYYLVKENKLLYPVRKRSEYIFYPLNPIRFDEVVFNLEDKTLTKKQFYSDKFLSNFKNRFKLNLEQTINEVKK